jgi:cytochrome c oxidase subunit IV
MTRHFSTHHYVLVWLALVVLTVVSWAVSYAELGAFEIPVALVIATIKSTLVLLYFMHLAHERFTNAMVPIVAAALIALLVGLTALDVATRHTFPPRPDPALLEP